MTRTSPFLVSLLLTCMAGSAVTSLSAAGVAAGAAAVAPAVTPRDAIVAAVRARMGRAVVAVDVEGLDTTVSPVADLVAQPDPAGRAGRATRFTLGTGAGRQGSAVATVRVRALVARARVALDRGTTLDAGQIVVSEDEVRDLPMAYLPTVEELTGRRVRRSVAAGEVLTLALAEVPPVVQAGDPVTVGVTVGHVRVTAEGIASGSGRVGDIVRVQRPGRRGLLTARVRGRGEVEVLP